jgi:hypothetical protein
MSGMGESTTGEGFAACPCTREAVGDNLSGIQRVLHRNGSVEKHAMSPVVLKKDTNICRR